MSVTLEWPEIAWRLAMAVIAGALLGINRTERGMAAGLRTTLLVSLAAAASMIQVNLLLGASGRSHDSFVMMDLMRLPLGILTGMGFIGAGAILRRGDKVHGVTTAATLWLATSLGLCFGGGQVGLGLATLSLGVAILWSLKWLELRIKQERHAVLMVAFEQGGPTEEEVRFSIQSSGYQVFSWDVTYSHRGEVCCRKIRSEVHWSGKADKTGTPDLVEQLAEKAGVRFVRWKA